MKKFILFFLIFAFSSVAVFSQGVLNEILKRQEAHSKLLKSVQGEISITKSFESQSEVFYKRGTFYFLPSRSYALNIEIETPKKEIFSMYKDEYVFYQTNPSPIFLDDKTIAYSGKIGNSQKNTFILFSLLQNFSRKELRTNYNIAYEGVEKTVNGTDSWHLVLNPKTKGQIKKIDIWIDNNGMIIQSKILEDNGSSTLISLNNLKKNSGINVNKFAVRIPKGVTLLKN